MSDFNGLRIALSSLYAQRKALQVTGQNTVDRKPPMAEVKADRGGSMNDGFSCSPVRFSTSSASLFDSRTTRAFSIRSMVAAKQTEGSKQLLDSIVSDHYSKFINTGFIF